MSKAISIILIAFAIALIAFNVTKLNGENIFEGDSLVALIGIVASLCAIVLLLIYTTSKKIQSKMNEN